MLDTPLETAINTPFVVYGWRFVNADGTSMYQKTPQDVGTLYTVSDPTKRIAVMRYGFHVSSDALVALRSGAGFFVERARLSGTLDLADEVVAASERTPLWRADATKLLAGFTADCAARAVKYIRERGITPTDKTERYIQLARDFATGAKTDTEVQAEITGQIWTPDGPFEAKQAEGAALGAASIFEGFAFAFMSLGASASAIASGAAQDPKANPVFAQYGELLWQSAELHDRLITLAPAGYSEPGMDFCGKGDTGNV